ncbi:MAG: PEP-CTERM-box response regulator transcription factor [Pseudomonadota bacterium]
MSQTAKRLLIVDDDSGLQSQLRWCFADYEVEVAGDRPSALAALRAGDIGVVTLDLGLPPDPTNASEGLRALTEILAFRPTTKVVVVTGSDDRSHALQAVAAGAYDFYQKPIDADVLRLIVDRAQVLYTLEEEHRRLQRQINSPLDGVIAGSAQMAATCRLVEKVAPTEATVLLLGESGTGKELLARAVHQLSPRAGRRFEAINCAAIPDSLLESELFGYEKGAFTGAVKQTIGRIEYAHGGTLFLDEIGDMPLHLQGKLLRFLQERVIERLGGRAAIPVDVRVVCATHRNLADMIARGEFREDLYYRLSEVVCEIPPLRDRTGDAVLLAHAFLQRFCASNQKQLAFSPDALDAIAQAPWPGNVRELENVIKRAGILADGKRVTAADLGLTAAAEENLSLREARDEAELRVVTQALARADGNIGKVAELLGVTRPTLYALLNKFKLR